MRLQCEIALEVSLIAESEAKEMLDILAAEGASFQMFTINAEVRVQGGL